MLIAARFRRKAKGLLFSPEHAGALLLAPCNDVHTAGMRHRLDIAFVDAQGLVLEAHRDVEPCRRLRNKSAEAVVERFSSCATPWFTAGDRVGVVCMKGDRKGKRVRLAGLARSTTPRCASAACIATGRSPSVRTSRCRRCRRRLERGTVRRFVPRRLPLSRNLLRKRRRATGRGGPFGSSCRDMRP